MKTISSIVAVLMFASAALAQWSVYAVDTKASFRGLSVVDSKIVWASGTGGTVIKTVDGGKAWKVMQVPGAEKLDFRDIEAFDERTAYIISIGEGESSRIYKTDDGGETWDLQHQNMIPEAFFDALAFWDRDNGVVMSDPVGGYFYLLRTRDGGKTWNRMDTEKMFPAEKGEAAFAASGTCLVSNGTRNLWMVTGGAVSRVHRSENEGASWIAKPAPLISGGSGKGIFSLAMFDSRIGVMVGGDYTKPAEAVDNLALTSDGGKTWMKGTGLGGYRSGVAFVNRSTVVAVGTNGSDISRDGGKTWTVLDKENYNAVQAKGVTAIWAVGPRGVVARLNLRPPG
jgi:photosystem II stability/assembly factor-like uncharacterized protein